MVMVLVVSTGRNEASGTAAASFLGEGELVLPAAELLGRGDSAAPRRRAIASVKSVQIVFMAM